ncbi:hypothetical protein E2C01_090313 [Portunus trituberculatus]|uniref:Uncharacterized protein n=1 Tax=Portunus trituberculatus TaxID=210409 RepID=A0A5B7JPS6_PORTR|nr:hypothetical protein [Portunus trituberculatus]
MHLFILPGISYLLSIDLFYTSSHVYSPKSFPSPFHPLKCFASLLISLPGSSPQSLSSRYHRAAITRAENTCHYGN